MPKCRRTAIADHDTVVVATLSIATDSSDSQPLDVGGIWWRITDPSDRVGGRLKFGPDVGELVLTGGFSDPAVTDPDQTICGISSTGERMSLWHCYLAGESHTSLINPEQEIDEVALQQTWKLFLLIRGNHFPDGVTTEFDEISFTTPALAEWLAEPRPRHERETDPHRETISVDIPDSVAIPLTDGSLTLGWWTSSSHGLHSSIEVTPRFTWVPGTPSTIDEFQTILLDPVESFLTVAAGEPILTRSFRVAITSDDQETYKYGTAEIRRGSPDLPVPERGGHFWEHLIAYQANRDRFGELLGRWIDVARTHRAAFAEFFSVSVSPHMYGEEQFTRTVRALEIWSRLTDTRTPMTEDAFDAFRAKIKDKCSPAEWSFLRVRIQHANELTLKQRLDALVDAAPSQLQALLQRYDRFTRRVVDTRNSLTHLGSVEPAAFNHSEMYWAQQSLEALFAMTVLAVVGITDDRDELLARTPLWRSLTSAEFNPLLRADSDG